MRTHRGRRGIAPLSLDFEFDGDEVAVTVLPLCPPPTGKNPGTDRRRRRVGPRAGLHVFENNKISCSERNSNSGPYSP